MITIIFMAVMLFLMKKGEMPNVDDINRFILYVMVAASDLNVLVMYYMGKKLDKTNQEIKQLIENHTSNSK